MKTEVVIKELQTLAQIEKMQGARARSEIHRAAAEQLTEYAELKKQDTAPIKHGMWKINSRLSKTLGSKILICSECGANVIETAINSLHFCPNCGAKMDGE